MERLILWINMHPGYTTMLISLLVILFFIIISPFVTQWMVRDLPKKKPTRSNTKPSKPSFNPSPLPNHDISHLPTGTMPLIGRHNHLQQLDEFLASRHVEIASLIADNGVGKSALVEAWLKKMQATEFKGIKKVFAWSFYGQECKTTQTNSVDFFNNALPFFGHTNPLPEQDEERANTLVTLLQKQSYLLVLDGVETLQYPDKTCHACFADAGFYRFLNQLFSLSLETENVNNGSNRLLLMTSRQKIPCSESKQEGFYREIPLDNLTTEEGVELLKSLGVNGSESQLSNTTTTLQGHPLGLMLLGNFLTHYHKGDIARRDQIKDLLSTQALGDHALKVINHYHTNDACALPAIHRTVLKMMGLFNRPMEMELFKLLTNKASIALPLKQIDTHKLQQIQKDLIKIGVLLPQKLTGLNHNQCWDTHPLIKSFFAKKVRQEDPEGYQQAQGILFDYFQALPNEEYPETLEELNPLYRAVYHGCQAKLYKKTKESVLKKRIYRGDAGYSGKLGAYSSDLTALAGFFPEGWDKPPVRGDLLDEDRAWLLADAAFCLMSLGRLTEALGPRREGMLLQEQMKNWEQSAIAAATLCDLLIPVGKLDEALKTAYQGKQWAEESGDVFLHMYLKTYVATVLHRMGEVKESLRLFKETEQMQTERQPGVTRLYGLLGKRYCDLLLEQAKNHNDVEDVLERAKESYQAATQSTHLFSIALDHLTQGRALTALGRPLEAEEQFKHALLVVKKSGMTHYIPQFYIHRIAFFRQHNKHEQAKRDLREALESSERCCSLLYKADCKLLQGHILLDENQLKAAKQALLTAEKLNAKMGYGKSVIQAKILRSRWYHHNGQSKEAIQQKKQALAHIEEKNQWGLVPMLERETKGF